MDEDQFEGELNLSVIVKGEIFSFYNLLQLICVRLNNVFARVFIPDQDFGAELNGSWVKADTVVRDLIHRELPVIFVDKQRGRVINVPDFHLHICYKEEEGLEIGSLSEMEVYAIYIERGK